MYRDVAGAIKPIEPFSADALGDHVFNPAKSSAATETEDAGAI